MTDHTTTTQALDIANEAKRIAKANIADELVVIVLCDLIDRLALSPPSVAEVNVQESEREKFEAYAKPKWPNPIDWEPVIGKPHRLNNYELQAALDAWNARAVLSQPPAVQVPKGLALIGEMHEHGVVWRGQNPHAHPVGTRFYASPAVRVEEVPGWISVEKSLPEVETRVFILRRGECDIGEIRWDYPSYEETYQPFRYWDSPINEGQDWDWSDITHWMPIPPAPASQKEGGKE